MKTKKVFPQFSTVLTKGHRFFLSIVVLCAIGLLSACSGKDNSDLIVGTWTNTDQSFETTIAGTESIPEGVIEMQFTANSVKITDIRRNCIPEWKHYTLTTKNGKQILQIEDDFEDDSLDFLWECIVEELSTHQMVLSSNPGPDMGYKYVMKR